MCIRDRVNTACNENGSAHQNMTWYFFVCSTKNDIAVASSPPHETVNHTNDTMSLLASGTRAMVSVYLPSVSRSTRSPAG